MRLRPRRPRRWPRYVLVGLAAVAILVVLALIPARAARQHLFEAREAMEAGKDALLAGDPTAAERAFNRARVEFLQAGNQSRNPVLRLAGWLPVIGRTPDAAALMADAGEDVAEAGAAVAGGLAGLPDGLGSLAPTNGRIPLEPFQSLAPKLRRASELVDRAAERVRQVSRSWLIGPVRDARREFAEQLDGLEDRVEAAAIISARLPAFLGAEGTRRYFVGAQNPAELRGTGGLMGAFAILTADDGQLTLSSFRDIYDLPEISEEDVEPPNPDYARRYPAAFWPSVNLTPDFPSSAQVIETLYEETEGLPLDGTIVADPYALEAMLDASGQEVTVPALDRTVTAANVVQVLSNDAALVIEDPDVRKALLGDVAKAVLDHFLRGGASPAASARAVTEAASGGHLLVHSTDPELQRGFELARAAGRLLPGRDDYLKVVVNNGGANKVDFFARREVSYAVRLGAEGTGSAELTVRIRNDAPATALAEPGLFTPPGHNVSLLSVFAADDARVTGVLEDARESGTAVDEELGHVVLENTLEIPRTTERGISYQLALPSAWTGSSSGGVYRLVFQGQPTIQPTRLRLDVLAPAGTTVVRTSVPMQVSGNRAVWEGMAPAGEVFEIEFQKPFVARAWESLADFFSKRVVTF